LGQLADAMAVFPLVEIEAGFVTGGDVDA